MWTTLLARTTNAFASVVVGLILAVVVAVLRWKIPIPSWMCPKHQAALTGTESSRVDPWLGPSCNTNFHVIWSAGADHRQGDVSRDRRVADSAPTPATPQDWLAERLQIAAHALALGTILVTNNQREFKCVPMLSLAN